MICELTKDKKVLFITTKEMDYIRNSQELRILSDLAKHVNYIGSGEKNYFQRIIKIYINLLRECIKKRVNKGLLYSCDVIFVGFAPQLILPFFGKAFTDCIVIVDFFVSVYDTLVCDRRVVKQDGFFAKLCHYMDSATIRKADWIITDTKAHANYFEEEFGADNNKIETIYLEADKSIFYPRQQKKTKFPKDKFIVLYFGSILPLQGVEIILNAIRELKDDSTLLFDIIGPIPSHMNKPNQDNVKYTEWLSQKELAERISQADLCLAGHFHGDIAKANRTIPGKAFIYDAMGKTMILGDSEANREYFKPSEKHYFVKMGDVQSLAKTIKDVQAIILKKAEVT